MALAAHRRGALALVKLSFKPKRRVCWFCGCRRLTTLLLSVALPKGLACCQKCVDVLND